jgi:class 3 adenylate cyclase
MRTENLAVMFTDIQGYTPVDGRCGAGDLARECVRALEDAS